MEKQAYYTLSSINSRANEFLDQVKSFRNRHGVFLRPNGVSLLILDMQEFFLDSNSHAHVPSAPALIPGLQKLISRFQELGRPVIFTRHVNTDANARMMKTWWNDLIRQDHPSSRVVKDLISLDTRDQFKFIMKSQYDAFYSTDLENFLLAKDTEQVVITGVMTHLCCETTARSAFMKGFEVFFTVDGTASYNEDFHQASLLNLSHGFSTPVLVEELLLQLEKSVVD